MFIVVPRADEAERYILIISNHDLIQSANHTTNDNSPFDGWRHLRQFSLSILGAQALESLTCAFSISYSDYHSGDA